MGSDRQGGGNRRRRAALHRRWLAGAIAAAATLASSLGVAQISPGDLARPHARLEGVTNCTKCHSAGDAVSASLCLSCHTALRARIRKGAGYHARVGNRSCESCHPDHRGRGVSMVTWPGGGPRSFDHARNAGYPLRGKHAQLGCRDCHKAQHVRGPLGGASPGRTYLGLPTACIGCHADPHQPTLGTRCETCHDEREWGGAQQGFDHSRARFPLRGAHARVACARCHPGATEDRPATFRGVAFAQCTDCHQDPHEAKMGPAASCPTCHSEVRWTDSRYDLARHAPRTFPLTGAHARTRCTACHGQKLAGVARTPCVSCHHDPHSPSLGTECNRCHSTASWGGGPTAARATSTFHDRTAFPLEGRHAQVDCKKCHDPHVPAARRFRPIAHDRCADCHEDPHQGELRARADGGACEPCHDVEGWAPARFELPDHAATRFPLDGAHRAVPCAACHPAPPAAPAFRREDRSCEACHADPHGGQFTGRASAQGGCATCHATTAWVPSRFGKPEHAAAGFPLADAHDVACARCHAPSAAATRATWVGLAPDCGACHRDVHAGQFGRAPCSGCHAGARFAPTVGFDHARTRFPLRGEHAEVRCAGCHRPIDLPSAPRTVLYRFETPACDGCHETAHGDPGAPSWTRAAALARATARCGGCHVETSWRVVAGRGMAGFDHSATDAPLVGAHERVPCAQCHVPDHAVTPMGQCASCHEDRHAGRMTEPCATCHAPRSWAPDRTLSAHRRTRFPLVGAHAVQACRTCHVRAAEGDFRDARAACETCHLRTVRERNPHPPHVGVAFLTRCDRCHGADAWRPARFDHGHFFALTGAHASAPCEGCHAGGRFAGTPRGCAACHDGQQVGASIDHGPFAGQPCDACHGTTAWKPARFDHRRWFPLTGAHDLACGRCHTTGQSAFTCLDGCHSDARAQHDEVRGFQNTSTACYHCHARGQGGD